MQKPDFNSQSPRPKATEAYGHKGGEAIVWKQWHLKLVGLRRTKCGEGPFRPTLKKLTHLHGAPLGVVHPDEVVGEAQVVLELPEEVDAEAGAALGDHAPVAWGIVGEGAVKVCRAGGNGKN